MWPSKGSLKYGHLRQVVAKYRCDWYERSAIMDVGLDMPDPGQVPDGAKCGDQKVCIYSQTCFSDHLC
jgi:hypothetical protein